MCFRYSKVSGCKWWCKKEGVGVHAFNDWDKKIHFYNNNTNHPISSNSRHLATENKINVYV